MKHRVLTIGPAVGLKGEFIVRLHTDSPELRLQEGSVLETEDGKKSFTVKGARVQARSGRNNWIVKLRGVDTREMAESLRNLELFVDAETAEEDDDSFYLSDLVGLKVLDRNSEGEEIAEVVAVIPSAQDLLEIKFLVGESAGKKCLIPFVRAIVPVVDIVRGIVEIDAPEGLLEEVY